MIDELDMSGVLECWQVPVKRKTVTQEQTSDFETDRAVTVDNIEAVPQVADKAKLNVDTVDWSRKYYMFHSTSPLEINQYIEYKGADYKLIDLGDWTDYGFYVAVGEETKQPLLVAT